MNVAINATRSTDVPGTLSTVWTLARVTLKRLSRGKAMWIGIMIAALPVINATVIHAYASKLKPSPGDMFTASVLLLALLPAMFVGASIGEEIEDRTSTYLWSRPIARWVVLGGKLCALVPIVIVLICGGWYAANEVWLATAPTMISCVALAAGCVAVSLVASGIATIVPKHGMALTIGYVLVDVFIGALPFSLQELSLTHQTQVLARLDSGPHPIGTPLIAMLLVSGLWGAIGFLRIRRLEA